MQKGIKSTRLLRQTIQYGIYEALLFIYKMKINNFC